MTTNGTKIRHRSRTIDMPETKAALISTAANYLGMSGAKFIDLAIEAKIHDVITDMLNGSSSAAS
jgi:hypothetical protein